MEKPELLDEWVQRVMLQDRAVTEKRLALWLHPKPKWFPGFVWRAVLTRALELRETPPKGAAGT